MAISAHHYQRFVRASPAEVFAAISTSAGIRSWWHDTAYEQPLVEGEPYRSVLPDGRVATEGVVEALSAPTRLVQTWRPMYAAELAAEPAGSLDWTVEAVGDGLTRLTLVHGGLAFSPLVWAEVEDGWQWLLDNLKSVLETGSPLPDWTGESEPVTGGETDWHRSQAVEANNSVWELLERPDRTPEEDEELLRRAYAAAYHWNRTSGTAPANEVRASYLVGKAHLVTASPDLALRAAERMLGLCAAHDLQDFDLAYAHELHGRALAALGRSEEAAEAARAARAVTVADEEDREIVERDLADLPP